MDRTVVDPLVGRVLDGRYRVGPRVARGGMATVHEALDLRLDRICAVKVMHSGLGDDEDFARRFVREARSAARLSHPNVVSVFDQGDDDGTLFLAMEYLPGETLRDLIRVQAPLTPRRALSLLEPVLGALAAAHAAGLIHRDVKPENVLIADDGRVKVADFGLARAVSADTQHTATGGVLIGTVSYLAPELVVEGRSDARSDVYAAGVLLYEMLTGRKPHEGESPIQVAYKHVHEDVPPPSRLVPGIPAYVDALVARATARDRELRPADARVLLHQLRRVKGALDHGVVDDPDLTSDLALTVPVVFDHGIDYLTEDDTDQLAAGSGAGDEGVDDDQARRELGVGAVVSPAQLARAGHVDTTTVDRDATGVIGREPAGPARRSPAPPAGGRARPPRRRRRGPLVLVAVLLLALLAGVGGWWYGFARWTSTPGLINMSAAEARASLDQAGLEFDRGRPRFSETVEAGQVMATDPSGGERVLDGGAVTVFLSRGPERYEVPALRGMTQDEATQALERDNLALGDVTGRYDEQVAEGVVLRSDPGNGRELRRDTPVDLVVSRGPEPIEVPDLTGRAADRAEQRLTGLGLEVSTSSENSDSVPKGRVITQSPSTGTLYRGDAVSLTVSEGPVLVEVPNVRAVGVAQATERLEELGFAVETAESSTYLGLGFVSSADPDFGTMAPRGSTITLYLV